MKKLVAVTGPKGAGKDTAILPLLNEGYDLIKFADPLKGMIRTYLAIYGVDNVTIERMVEGDMKEVPHEAWCGRTTRHAMQTLGTEWGRMLIGNKIWTNVFERRVEAADNVVCTDLRFTNEGESINSFKKKGYDVKVVRVVRTGEDKPMDVHQSEVELWGIPVTDEIHNAGTVDELRDKMRTIAG